MDGEAFDAAAEALPDAGLLWFLVRLAGGWPHLAFVLVFWIAAKPGQGRAGVVAHRPSCRAASAQAMAHSFSSRLRDCSS
jgi:hypothetical protein